jgi:hypothetical protein
VSKRTKRTIFGFPKITVYWIDSCGPPDTWKELAEVMAMNCPVVKTRGYLLREDKIAVWIAGTVCEHGQVGGVVIIPKVSILKRKK